MKNLVIILMLFIPFISNGQDDRVYWLHGFGGEVPGRWQIYQQNFQNARNLTSRTPTYENNDLDGVFNAANIVDGQMVSSPNNIIIGHSMGGIVAREMERSFPARVGGIVTVASPNKGTFALNSLRRNEVIPAIETGLNTLLEGPVADITIHAPSVLIVGLTIRQNLDDFFAGLRGILLDRIPDVTRQTAVELSANSEYFDGPNGLNNRNSNIPVLNIIFEENDDQGLRIGAAALNAPEDSPLHTYDDGELVGRRNQAASWYKGFKDTYNVLRWTGGLQYAYYTSLKNKYAKGENYLNVHYAADYNDIIGASRTETYTATRYVYECSGNGGGDHLPRGRSMSIRPLPLPDEECDPVYDVDCNPSGDDCRLVRETYTATRRINEGSDGLIPLSSQRMNGMSNNDVYTAEGVNHLEVGNHPEMTRILNEIFDRGIESPFNRTAR